MMLEKNNPIRSKKIRDSARGEDCQIRLGGICNYSPETTVFCHLPGNGMKASDIHGAYGCSSCHDEVDGRTQIIKDRQFVELMFRQAAERTQNILVRKGLIGAK